MITDGSKSIQKNKKILISYLLKSKLTIKHMTSCKRQKNVFGEVSTGINEETSLVTGTIRSATFEGDHQTTTPSTPLADRSKLYFKSDAKVYALDEAGTETLVGPTASTADVVGPSLVLDTDLAVFSGTDGKVITKVGDGVSAWPCARITSNGQCDFRNQVGGGFEFDRWGDNGSRFRFWHLTTQVHYLDGRSNANSYIQNSRTSTGGVGIGTSSPAYKLHAAQDIDGSTSVTVDNATAGAAAQSMFTALTDTANSALYMGMNSSGFTASGSNKALGGFIGTGSAATGGLSIMSTNATADMRFYTGGGADANERLTITDDGFVGIGNSAPTFGLSVEGSTLAETTFQLKYSGAGGFDAPYFQMYKFDTSGAIGNSDNIAIIQFSGNDQNGDERVGAQISCSALEDFTDTACGSSVSIYATDTGTTALYEAASFAADEIKLNIAGFTRATIVDAGTTFSHPLTFPQPVGELYADTNVTATVISVTQTWTKAVFGSTTAGRLVSFTHTTPNRLVCTSTMARVYHIGATITLSPASNLDINWHLGIFKNGTLVPGSVTGVHSITSGHEYSTAIHCMAQMTNTDYIEIYVLNNTSPSIVDCTVSCANLFAIGTAASI